MPAIQYPFIDVAVHKDIRERFARGEALVLFSADLKRVFWANGAGAAFFGASNVYDFIEQGPAQRDIAFRQMETTARQLTTASSRTGESRKLLVRAGDGFRRTIREAAVQSLEVRPGDPAILFSVSADPTADNRLKLMLSGFEEPDTHMALLGDHGEVLEASRAFARLGITDDAAAGFTQLVSHVPERLLKRPISTALGYLPAAIGQLSANPGLYILFVVETALEDGPAVQPSAEPQPPEAPELPADAAPGPGAAGDYDAVVDAIGTIEEIEEEDDHQETDLSPGDDVTAPAEQPGAAVADLPAPVTAPVSAAAETGEFRFEPARRPIRFVWKIDATGRFSDVSDEFAQAVGPRAADINGQTFGDLAALFNLDPEGKIAELLKRRDTWSGKTIYWPVQGTALKVPVDLAALPTYTRNRDFDGFRGFGIVRLADAVEDPDAAGLTFVAAAPDAAAVDETAAVAAEAQPGFTFEPETPESAPTEEDVPVAEARPDDQPSATDLKLAEEAVAEDGEIDVEDMPPADDTAAEHMAAEDDAATADEGHAQQPVAAAPESGRVEPPVLQIVESEGRRHSDKVIRLEERRARGRDGLTPGEQAAFREIARKLDPLGLRERQEEGQETQPATTQAPAKQQEQSVAPIAPADRARQAHDDEITATDPGDDAAATAAQPLPIGERELTAEIVDLMPVALLVHRGDDLIHANREFLQLTGYEDLDALLMSGGLDALLERQAISDGDHSGQVVVVRADDELVPVSARLQSVRYDGASALMLSLVPMATSRGGAKPASDELRRLKVETEELRSILETATDGVVLLGSDGEIRSMNRSASALFNFDDQEMRGKPFVTLFAHESQKAILDYLNGLTDNGVASVLNDGREVIGREASGGFIPLFMTIGRLTSSNGYCAVIRDITQWKRTEEELRSAKRAAETANAHKTDFLARVSHEIRTPLNAIIGFSDMMASEHFGPIGNPRYGEYAADIGRSGRHVLDIVNDLLDISKIEAGEMDLDFAAVGLNETIASAVAIVQPQANSQRVIIRTALSQAVPLVVADSRSIKQIVLNILANAIRFTPSGGQIIVSTAYEANGSVVLRIRDTGIGMTRSELEQAMKPFRQVAAGGRSRGDGTGLGLPLTKAMVDANRANFSIHSAPNEGTLVEISFPSQRVLAN